MNVLVVGLGNEILGDDGVGIHAIRKLINDPRFASVPQLRMVEVGTAILEVLDDLEWADHVVMLDAVQIADAPGSLYWVSDVALPDAQAGLHGLTLMGAMALLGPDAPRPRTSLLGVVPERIDYSLDLSSVVARAISNIPASLEEHLHRLRASEN